MRKRSVPLILIIALLIVMVATYGYASPYGLFKNHPVVKVEVDGQEVEGDVPAIIMQDRTLVPIRFVAKELGADVEWDGDNYTVLITTAQEYIVLSDAEEGWQALSTAENALYARDFMVTGWIFIAPYLQPGKRC